MLQPVAARFTWAAPVAQVDLAAPVGRRHQPSQVGLAALPRAPARSLVRELAQAWARAPARARAREWVLALALVRVQAPARAPALEQAQARARTCRQTLLFRIARSLHPPSPQFHHTLPCTTQCHIHNKCHL